MARLFISHSSRNDDWATALQCWLIREGWSGKDDLFLDFDPERGIVAGQRWLRALEDAATRCEAVLFLVSEHWLASKWCCDEYQLANKHNKKLFALLIEDIALDRLPGGLSAQWQVVHLKGEPAERFLTVHPRTQHPSPVHIAEAGLKSLKRGLEKAGIGPETFEMQPDPNGPFGWRAPYRGLEALEPEDAAIFFGRSADIVRGIDALRGLAAHRPPWLLVILGASGAGKSSFQRAGLWPRLARDDSQWLPLRAIRAGRGGAIEGSEGLLAALEDVNRRFKLRASRADLRERLATPKSFVALMRELRQAAARRVLVSEPPYPLPVLCLDQGEELFGADAGPESEKLLKLARAAMDDGEALLLVTIRSDAYSLMQSARALAGINQVPLSLGPMPHGEIARIIREPSETLRRQVGPEAPVFEPVVVERLQSEIEGEPDALPLLAFVLQRLMREHAGTSTIGLEELKRTGGVTAAIEWAAEAAFTDARFAPDRTERQEALRRLFIPRLARVNRESKLSQRRVARQNDLDADLLPLARALTQRRLLVVKVATRPEGAIETATATIEVAHEALLRLWPTLQELLAENRDALLLLDGVRLAAADWDKIEAARKADFLAHRGSRLLDAQALASRGDDWEREIAPARAYLAACQAREVTELEEKEAALRREQEIAVERDRTKQASERSRRQRSRYVVAALILLLFGAFAAGTLLWVMKQYDAYRVRVAVLLAEESLRAFGPARALLAAMEGIGDSLPDLPEMQRLGYRALAQLRERRILEDPAAVQSVQFAPHQPILMTTTQNGWLRFWKLETGELIDSYLVGGRFLTARWSPDGTQLFVSARDIDAFFLVPCSHEKLRPFFSECASSIEDKKRSLNQPVGSGLFSPDGRWIVTGAFYATTKLWDVASTEMPKKDFGQSGSWIAGAAFSHDSQRLAVGNRTGEIRILRIAEVLKQADESPEATLKPQAARDQTGGTEASESRALVNSLAFHPTDPNVLLATYQDGTARLWDIAENKNKLLFTRMTVLQGVFNHDGDWVATAHDDRVVRLWPLRAVQPTPQILRGHGAMVFSVAYSPDGTTIATGSSDRTARIWSQQPALGATRVSTHGPSSGSPAGKVSVRRRADELIVTHNGSDFAVRTPPGFGEPAAAAVSPSGKDAVIAPKHGRPYLFRLGTKGNIVALPGRPSDWRQIGFFQEDREPPPDGALERIIGITQAGEAYSWPYFGDLRALKTFAESQLPYVGEARLQLRDDVACRIRANPDKECQLAQDASTLD